VAKQKKPASFLSLTGLVILPGFYRQITFPALIMMFSGPDGKRYYHYTYSQESNDLNFLFHALIFIFLFVATCPGLDPGCYSP